MKTELHYRSDFVKDLFNRISPSYNTINFVFSLGLSNLIRKQVIRKYFDVSDKHLQIADLLSGCGEALSSIQEVFPNSDILALDFSEEMNRISKLKNWNNKIKIVNEDVLQNHLPGNHFDVVICMFGLKHFDEYQTKCLANEVLRILKKGGRFVFLEISIPYNKIMRVFFSLYLKSILPLSAKIFSDKQKDYKMLYTYLDYFKNCKKASKLFNEIGLNSSYNSHFLGTATSIYGLK